MTAVIAVTAVFQHFCFFNTNYHESNTNYSGIKQPSGKSQICFPLSFYPKIITFMPTQHNFLSFMFVYLYIIAYICRQK